MSESDGLPLVHGDRLDVPGDTDEVAQLGKGEVSLTRWFRGGCALRFGRHDVRWT